MSLSTDKSVFDMLLAGCRSVRAFGRPGTRPGKTYHVIGWCTPSGDRHGPSAVKTGCVRIRTGPPGDGGSDGGTDYHHSQVDVIDFEDEAPLRLKHAKHMSDNLEAMTELHDVRLLVDGAVLTAPGILLSAASPVFKRMLASKMQEGQSRTVTIDFNSPGAAKAMVKYIIHGVLEIGPEDLAELAALAEKYDLQMLREAAVARMPSVVTKETVRSFVRVLRLLPRCERAALAYQEITDIIRSDCELFDGILDELCK